MDGVGYFLAWVAFVLVCADGYVLWRVHTAPEEGRRALSTAARAAGAGIAGFVIAVALVFVALIVALFEWVANGGRVAQGWTVSLGLLLAAPLVLVGLPVGVAIARRRRR